jgi:hypothetical protein
VEEHAEHVDVGCEERRLAQVNLAPKPWEGEEMRWCSRRAAGAGTEARDVRARRWR